MEFFTILTTFRNPQKGATLYILVFPYKECCIKISKLLELLKGHVFIDWPIRQAFVQGIGGQTRTARVLKYSISGTL